MNGADLFSTVPQKDYLSLFEAGKLDYPKVVKLLDFKKRDVAKASSIPLHSVRYDQKMPKELEERLREWAIALAVVASHFKDVQKTVLWFKIPNPLLGNVSPRDMLRVGRFNKLIRFVQNAVSESQPRSA
jgi:hypothetical protein